MAVLALIFKSIMKIIFVNDYYLSTRLSEFYRLLYLTPVASI